MQLPHLLKKNVFYELKIVFQGQCEAVVAVEVARVAEGVQGQILPNLLSGLDCALQPRRGAQAVRGDAARELLLDRRRAGDGRRRQQSAGATPHHRPVDVANRGGRANAQERHQAGS